MRLLSNLALILSFATSFIAPSLGHAHHGRRHNAHRHTDLARRDPGEVDTYKRDGGDRFTFFADGLGACGIFNVASDFIVALNSAQFSQDMCFKMITISINGKSAQAQITDECPGCPPGGLDFSQGLFEFFADVSVGVLYGSWSVNGASPPPASTPPPPPPPPPPPTTPADQPTSTWAPPPPPPTSSPQQASTPTSKPSSTATLSGSSATSTGSGTSASAPSQPTTGTNVTVPVGTVPGGSDSVLFDMNLALVEIGQVLVISQSL